MGETVYKNRNKLKEESEYKDFGKLMRLRDTTKCALAFNSLESRYAYYFSTFRSEREFEDCRKEALLRLKWTTLRNYELLLGNGMKGMEGVDKLKWNHGLDVKDGVLDVMDDGFWSVLYPDTIGLLPDTFTDWVVSLLVEEFRGPVDIDGKIGCSFSVLFEGKEFTVRSLLENFVDVIKPGDVILTTLRGTPGNLIFEGALISGPIVKKYTLYD